jgi:hypothetical protein
MHDLKKIIGLLDDAGQLLYLKQLDLPAPVMPDFGKTDIESQAMTQAFYQSKLHYYHFVKGYMDYLTIKTMKPGFRNKSMESKKIPLDALEWDINWVLEKVEEQVTHQQ